MRQFYEHSRQKTYPLASHLMTFMLGHARKSKLYERPTCTTSLGFSFFKFRIQSIATCGLGG